MALKPIPIMIINNVLMIMPLTHALLATCLKSESVLNSTTQALLPKPKTLDLHMQLLYSPIYSKSELSMSHRVLPTASIFPRNRDVTARKQRNPCHFPRWYPYEKSTFGLAAYSLWYIFIAALEQIMENTMSSSTPVPGAAVEQVASGAAAQTNGRREIGHEYCGAGCRPLDEDGNKECYSHPEVNVPSRVGAIGRDNGAGVVLLGLVRVGRDSSIVG